FAYTAAAAGRHGVERHEKIVVAPVVLAFTAFVFAAYQDAIVGILRNQLRRIAAHPVHQAGISIALSLLLPFVEPTVRVQRAMEKYRVEGVDARAQENTCHCLEVIRRNSVVMKQQAVKICERSGERTWILAYWENR